MPNKTEESIAQPTDRMSITEELSSKRLLHYNPGLNRIPATHLMRKAYIHSLITADKQIDNSIATGGHQGRQLSRQQELQHSLQFDTQHRQHHSLHLWRHLIFDIIYAPLG